MISVSPEVYNDAYYKDINNGGELFFRTHGKKLPRRLLLSLDQVKIRPEDTVLDFGCGRGDLVFYLAPRCKNVSGIDYSKHAIRLCERIRTKKHSNQDNIIFKQSTIQGLRLRKNSIDKIFLLDVVEHLYPDELDLLLDKLRKGLRKDGVIVIHTCPNTNFYRYGYKIIRFLYPILRIIPPLRRLLDTKPNWKGLKRLPKNPEENSHNMIGHVNEMNPKKLKDILKSHGFNVKVKTYPFSREFDTFISRIVYALLLIQPLKFMFSADIMGVARK